MTNKTSKTETITNEPTEVDKKYFLDHTSEQSSEPIPNNSDKPKTAKDILVDEDKSDNTEFLDEIKPVARSLRRNKKSLSLPPIKKPAELQQKPTETQTDNSETLNSLPEFMVPGDSAHPPAQSLLPNVDDPEEYSPDTGKSSESTESTAPEPPVNKEEKEHLEWDQYGYTPDFDWSALAADELSLHDEIYETGFEQLEKITAKEALNNSPLMLWAAAKQYLIHQKIEIFIELLTQLLTLKPRHPALNYVEIHLFFVGFLAREALFEPASKTLEIFLRDNPDHESTYMRFLGLLAIDQDDWSTGLTVLQDMERRFPEKLELLLDVGMDLIEMGFSPEGLEFLKRGQRKAARRGDIEMATCFQKALSQ